MYTVTCQQCKKNFSGNTELEAEQKFDAHSCCQKADELSVEELVRLIKQAEEA